MIAISLLYWLLTPSIHGELISEKVSEIKSKCWTLSELDSSTANSIQTALIFDICGQGSQSISTLSKYSISPDTKSLEFEGPKKKYHLLKFTEIFPETTEFLQKAIQDPDLWKIDAITADKKAFCTETLNTWFTVLEAQSSEIAETKEEKQARKETHGLYMTICWVYLTSLNIVLARYFRGWHFWIYFHIGLSIISGFVTFFSASHMYETSKDPYEIRKPDKFIHSRMGQTIVSLTIGEMFIGAAYSSFKLFTYNALITILLNRFHKLLGYALFLSGLYNCYLGWTFISSSYKIVFYLGVAIAASLFAFLEYRQRLYKNTEKYQVELPQMTHLEVLEQVKKGAYLVFADEYVVFVRNFYRAHPGGSFMLLETIGEDSGKYLVGCSSYSGQYNPYEHTPGTYSLIKDLAIGKVPQPEGYLVPTPKNYDPLSFKLVKKVSFNESTFILYFNHPDVYMAEKYSKLEWLGKHFMVILPENLGSTRRYYSSIFVDPVEWEYELGLSDKNEGCLKALKLIVKAYPDGKVSSYLDRLKIGESLSIRGPFGPGLTLESFSGEYLALAGGTGLVPFIDLVHAAQNHHGPKNFKITLFVFFRSKSHSFCMNILQKIHNDHKDWFDLIEVYSGSQSESTKSQILSKSSNLTLAWICGPSGFNRSFHSLLLQSGLNKHKIIVM